MAMNRIQFQPGLSMPEFLKDYGTEVQCEQALEAVRWPTGFRCPRCAGEAHYVLRDGVGKVFQCNACRHQASLIASTVFQGTKLSIPSRNVRIPAKQRCPVGRVMGERNIARP